MVFGIIHSDRATKEFHICIIFNTGRSLPCEEGKDGVLEWNLQSLLAFCKECLVLNAIWKALFVTNEDCGRVGVVSGSEVKNSVTALTCIH